MKKLLFFTLIILSYFTFGQTTLEQFNKDYLTNKKPTIIYFYTDWCAYCKIQENDIEKNDNLKTALNNDFYFLKINAESENEIQFLDEIYQPTIINNKFKTHHFTKIFSNDLEYDSYPLWIFLDKNLNKIDRFDGYMKSDLLYKAINKIKMDECGSD